MNCSTQGWPVTTTSPGPMLPRVSSAPRRSRVCWLASASRESGMSRLAVEPGVKPRVRWRKPRSGFIVIDTRPPCHGGRAALQKKKKKKKKGLARSSCLPTGRRSGPCPRWLFWGAFVSSLAFGPPAFQLKWLSTDDCGSDGSISLTVPVALSGEPVVKTPLPSGIEQRTNAAGKMRVLRLPQRA